MEFTGERFIPNQITGEIAVEHLSRYKAVSDIVKGKSVLDLACGDGYGSFIIAENAKYVLGIDISQETIDSASKKYIKENLTFQQGSADQIPIKDGQFDVVISFETVEHLPSLVQKKFLQEIRRVLRPDGILIMSTPDKKLYSDARNYCNKFHIKEFYRDEFEQFLKQFFSQIAILEQGTVQMGKQTVGIITDKFKCIYEEKKYDNNSLLYLIAICSNRSIKREKDSLCTFFIPAEQTLIQVDLFFDRGKNFSHNDKMMKSISNENGEYFVRFDFNNIGNIKRIKFDPIDKACCFSLVEVKTNISNISFEYPHSIKRNQQYVFIDMNPGIIITGEFPEHSYIQFRYTVKILSIIDIVRYYGGDLLQAIDKEKKIIQLTTEKQRDQQHIKQLQQEYEKIIMEEQNAKEKIEELQQDVKSRDIELNDIRSSHAWQIMLKFWGVRDIIIPMNSKRRLFAKLIYKTLTQPHMMFSKFNVENIKKFYHYIKSESPSDVEQRLMLHIPDSHNVEQHLNLLSITLSDNNIDEYEPLYFHEEKMPRVSIIIPVYNEFHYTYNCLASILRHTKEISYEILIADDGSIDATKKIEEKVHGIRVIRHEKNLRFLKNCNAAAKEARGEYLLFLNNDTQVQDDWLMPLVHLMDKDISIGMTGSKLLYPDGRLQEAGGILWNDGSAWNYGHGDDPTLVQYNYVKDVDYISGAAICIRHELWEKIGGFDERFAPAYCEDSDLAFEVRKAGYRVVYQPRSVVVHFEGVSNGCDVKSGIKKYQVENQQKFYDKWKDVLREYHFLNGQDVFWARDRSRGKKTIVVIDHYVPHYDNDAGGRTTFHYLNFFVQLGFHVIFVGDNYFRHEPYTTILENLGIEVLVGNNWDIKKFYKWALQNEKYIDFVCLNRPHIAIKYIDFVKGKMHAKVIYYGHDLHFIREQRQYEIEKRPELLASIKHWKTIECKLFRAADIVYTPGYYEQDVLRKMFPQKRIQAIPIYIYTLEELEHMEIPGVQRRKNLLFVGGFGHQPNEDAMKWFLEEIFPRIQRQHPAIKIYIVGSHPTAYIQSKASNDVVITGYISDNELEEYYKKCRIAVVPLRYGAGIKGKIVEAMCHGLPTVTTTIGAEGLPNVDKCIEVTNIGDVEAYINNVNRLLIDDDYWNHQSKIERLYIKDNFTTNRAKEILVQDLEEK